MFELGLVKNVVLSDSGCKRLVIWLPNTY